MHTVTLKNVPKDLIDNLKRSAALHRRSLNGEAIEILDGALRSRKVQAREVLARIEAVNREFPVPPLTDEFLREAIRKGRP